MTTFISASFPEANTIIRSAQKKMEEHCKVLGSFQLKDVAERHVRPYQGE